MSVHPRLTLERPLAVFDLETTGPYPQRDRIVDFTIVTFFPDGERREFSSLVNPTIPIPPDATAVHGITDAMVREAPTFAEVAPRIRAELAGANLAGYNVKRFDIPLLCAEFKRVSCLFSIEGRRIIDPYIIWVKTDSRDLSAAVQHFCGVPLEGAHRAQADVLAAIAVLQAQYERYADLPATVDALHEYCRDASWVDDSGRLVWNEGSACFGFGKHAGVPLQKLVKTTDGRDYCAWILKSDFPSDTKRIITDALHGTFPVQARPCEVADV